MDSDDREKLEEFRRTMAELRETRLVREPTSYSVAIGSGDRSQFPDEDSLRSLFTAFRPLWLEKETATFVKVCQVLHRASLTDEERQGLDDARRFWKETCKSSAFVINMGSKRVSPREYIDMYFNGKYFHRDREDRERRESFEGTVGQPFAQARLLDWVRQLVDAAAFVEQIVANVLEREAVTQAPAGI